MTIKEIIAPIEAFAPPIYQESYDNAGFQVGNPQAECTGALLTLDVTEAVVQEAIDKNCNLIIAHHPLIFKGIKRITGKNSLERIIIKAIQHNITIYAAHTNLDAMSMGVNYKIAEKLGIQRPQILQPVREKIYQLTTYVPVAEKEVVLNALFKAGAGAIGNYNEAAFTHEGTGSFKPNDAANPTIGTAGGPREYVNETRIEVIVPAAVKSKVLQSLFAAHSYETVAYNLVLLENENQTIGAGMIGTLPEPIPTQEFLKRIQTNMEAKVIRHTNLVKDTVQKIAFCGGSGSFLLNDALQQGADLFLTADYKYHQFFDAEDKIIIADIGHYESEQFTIEIFNDILNKNFSNFAILLSQINTNPINYFI